VWYAATELFAAVRSTFERVRRRRLQRDQMTTQEAATPPPFIQNDDSDSDSLYSNLSFAFTALIALAIYFLLFRQEEGSSKKTASSLSSKRSTAMAATATSSSSSSSSSPSDNDKFILLLGVDDQLFKTCFGKDEEWLQQPYSCRMESLSDDCSAAQLRSMLTTNGLVSVVIQEDVDHPHWNEIKQLYRQGGFVVYFGILGEFAAPARISQELSGGTMDWKFSAYTKHEYVLTDVAEAILGSDITKQQYTKCNLLSVPALDRLMLPETYCLRKYVEDCEGCDPEDDPDEFEREVEQARDSGAYERYRQQHENQCPLALHTDANHGGRFAYLGFVNGDGNIPYIVRALLSGGGKAKQQEE
jgi:hypothetical protein